MPTMVIGAVISLGVGFAARAMAPKAPVMAPVKAAQIAVGQARDPGSSLQPRDFSIKQALPARRKIYGDIVTGGFYFFHQVKNPYLYVGVLLSDGTIDNISHIIVEGKQYTLNSSSGALTGNSNYPSSLFLIEKGLGTDTQTRSAVLGAAGLSVPSTFRQQGVARAVLRMHYGNSAEEHADLWGGGLDPVFRVKGCRVYDPRAVGHLLTNSSTWTYSTNVALCAYDFMRTAWAGAIGSDDIDTVSVIDAANVCDTPITISGEILAQYQLSGIASADRPIGETLADMLSACGGTLIYSDGKFKLYADHARTSVLTIGDDDVTGPFQFVNASSIEEAVNVSQATFYDTQQSGQPTSSPSVRMSDDVITADGRQKNTTYDFPFTPFANLASRLAFMRMQRARAGKTIVLPVSDIGTFLDPMDVVTLNFEHASFLNGVYEVTGTALADIGCQLTLREYPADAYISVDDYIVS